MTIEENIRELAVFIQRSKRIVIFTGAGISTESGISDYRSKGGIWDRFQPVTIQEFLDSEEKRAIYWSRKYELYGSLKVAKPNDGHKAIVELEQYNKIKGVITQNIDGLQQIAGTPKEKILELHGTNRETICLSCSDITPWQESYKRMQNGENMLYCKKCKGLLKPNTISFGQALNQHVLEEAFRWASSCDLLLAIGSTLIVEPAASIPRLAKKNGAKLIIITLSETPLDTTADLKIENKAGVILTETTKLLKEIMVQPRSY